MGWISKIAKIGMTVATNLDKVDDISDIANAIPEKIGKIKEFGENISYSYRLNRYKKDINKIEELQTRINGIKARSEGREYEASVCIDEEQKLPIVYAISPQYNYLEHIGENLFAAEANDKWGIININNDVIIPFEYDDIYATSYDGSEEYIFPVCKNNRWGFINLKNVVKLDFVYLDAFDFKNDLASVAVKSETSDKNVYGYIDRSGKFVIPPNYDIAYSFNDRGCARIGTFDFLGDEKNGVINKSGGIIINCDHRHIFFKKEYIIAGFDALNSKFFNYSGHPIDVTEEMKEQANVLFDSVGEFMHSTWYRKNQNIKNEIIPYFNSDLKYGYFIQTDEGSFCKIEPVFDEAFYPNKFGYARVKYNGLHGVIKIEDKEVK